VPWVTGVVVAVGLLAIWAWDAREQARSFRGLSRNEVLCVKVIDGDTLDVRRPNGETERVRLLGIDCAETHNIEKQRRQAEQLDLPVAILAARAEEATAWVRRQALRRPVELVFPEPGEERDPYDRLLCYVEHDGMDLGGELLRRGLAVARRERHARGRHYQALAAAAREEGVGLYAD
jgi:micrococcal nuclease